MLVINLKKKNPPKLELEPFNKTWRPKNQMVAVSVLREIPLGKQNNSGLK